MNKKESMLSKKSKLGRLVLCIVLGLFVLVISSGAIFASENNSVNVNVNGQKLDSNAFIDSNLGISLVPFRIIFETLGANVKWDQQTQTIIANKGNILIKLKINDNYMFVNNTPKDIKIKPIIISGYTFVPLRVVSEVLGADVKWDGNTRTVYISSVDNVNTNSNANSNVNNVNIPKIRDDNIYSTPQQSQESSNTNDISNSNDIPHEKIISQLLSTLNCNKVEGNQLTFGIVNDYNYSNTQKWNKLSNEEKERCAQLKLNQLKVAKYPGFKNLIEGESVVFILSEYATTGKVLDQFNLMW